MSRLLIMFAAAMLIGQLSAVEKADANKAIHIHFLSGSKEYKSAKSLPAWQKKLETQFPGKFKFTGTWASDKAKAVEGMEEIANADLVVVFCRRWVIPAEQLKFLRDYCAAKKPIIGIRTASHAFNTWKEFDKTIWGGSYKGHGGGEEVQMLINADAKDHPILKGVQEWKRQGKIYNSPNNTKTTTLLLSGKGGKTTQPLAWVNDYNEGGRAFYTSMGYLHDFENENFLKIMLNAVQWTLQIDLEAK